MAAASLAFESALTRFFALAHYSEYGYWVLSLAMAGLALSGVVLSLWRQPILLRLEQWLFWLPQAALVLALLGYYGCALNPFNALEFQHPGLWLSQLFNIGLFYAALLPFFFCCGLFAGICLTGFERAIARLYASDLLGGALGVLGLLWAMFQFEPFRLLMVILPLLALAGWMTGGRLLSAVLCAAAELALWHYNPARISEYKPLAYALNTEDGRIVRGWASPRGDFDVIDAFTERLDVDLSNNAGLLGVETLPETLGLYKDGSRIACLPKDGYGDSAWFKATLEAFPWELKPKRALLIGTRGGFKMAAAAAPGIESDPDLREAISVSGLIQRPPLEFLRREASQLELIDISADFAVQDKFALTLEFLGACQKALSGSGVLSVGVPIDELGAYGAKLIQTVKALAPAERIALYRSAWSLRALVFQSPPEPSLLRKLKKFCDDRSFDFCWPVDWRGDIWNDLPTLGWGMEPGDGGLRDAAAEEAARAFAGQEMLCAPSFDLRPATLDRPYFFSTLKLSKIGEVFENIGQVPREELGFLVNLAVLLQALAVALLVLILPAASQGLRVSGLGRTALYFSCLGLGYLFFEVALIEKAGPWLQDRTLAFSIVLATMLAGSGIGSWFSARMDGRAREGMNLSLALIAASCLLAWLGLNPVLERLGAWPASAQAGTLAAMALPLSFGLGMPFSLGLNGTAEAARPWAWGLNGAMSVLAPPLAFLLSRQLGYSAVAGAALLLYFLAWLSLPKSGEA
jgi:hypothetical protein